MSTPKTTEPRGRIDFMLRHWRGLGWAATALLLLVVVLQNVEPTTVDLWFWSVKRVPKLVVVLVSMVVGGLAWEVIRGVLRRSR